MSGKKEVISLARHALFVPGTRADRFGKARTCGADIAILDLEDSVFPEDKEQALQNVLDHVAIPKAEGWAPVLVRVNSNNLSAEISRVLDHAAEDCGLVGFMIPKVEEPIELPDFGPELRHVPIIESARGLTNVHAIAKHPNVIRLAFGAMDFAAETNSKSITILDYARIQIVLASAVADIASPIDSPSEHIEDLAAVRKSAENAKELGFSGALSIHPAQIPVISQAFNPSDQEIDWARRIIDAQSSATKIDGKMVDMPIILQARRILELSELDH